MTVKELMNSGLIYGGNLVYIVDEDDKKLAMFLAKNFSKETDNTHCKIDNLEVKFIVNGYDGMYVTTK